MAFSDANVKELLSKIKSSKNIRQKNKIEYYNIPCAFDIETSLIEQGDEHHASMYIWQFGVGIDDTNYIIYGRYWLEFEKLITRLGYELNLERDKRRLVCFVHNFAYEFSFISRRFEWWKVFSVRPHKPLFAIMENGIEFRCSYLLSGMGLGKLGKELTNYKAKKQSGDLDYRLIRSPTTPLDKKELRYCIDDVHVLLNYIRERIDADGSICKLPYTKTGYARQFTKRKCFGSSHKKGAGKRKYETYRAIMASLTMTLDEYKQARYCFTGGFTHANAWHVDKILYRMGARDISSSYPTQLCMNLMPMSSPTLEYDIRSEDDPEFIRHLKEHCCIFYIEFFDLEPIIEYENFFSSSKVKNGENIIENNGRVVSMDKGILCLTEIDYQIAKKCYTWSKSKIFGFRWMEKGYLPKDFIISILSLYRDKTMLKGIPEKADEYAYKKSLLNSMYGVSVTSAIQKLITYETTEDGAEWGIDESKTEEELIDKYNNSKQRFTYYYWGIWCCKYAMKQLWDAIFYLKNDYVYTDTDSVKYLHPEKHDAFFTSYNEMIQQKLRLMCDYYMIPYSFINPCDIKGKEHPLGAWDVEADSSDPYVIFKTLGAKRYIYLQHGKVNLTTAGVRKEAIKYLLKKYGKYGIFEHFSVDLTLPSTESGKITAYYTDGEISGEAVDYMGNPFHYEEMSCVALVESEYSLSRGQKYLDYLYNFINYEECI